MNITKVLEKVKIEDSISIMKEAIQNPDKRVATLKDNQWLWRHIAKVYSQKWNDDVKKSFYDSILHPTKILKSNNDFNRIVSEIETQQVVIFQDMWDQYYIKILKQTQLVTWKTAIVLWIAYKEEQRWPIKYKHTLLYFVDQDTLKQLIKKYDMIDKSLA